MKYAILIGAVVLALFFRVYLVSVYKVSSQSMAPNLLAGDYILASKISFGLKIPWLEKTYFRATPSRGDLIVFHKNSKIYIKRVLAAAQDEIEHINGEYLINSVKCEYDLSESLAAKKATDYAIFNEKCSGASSGALPYKVIQLTDGAKSVQMPKVKLGPSQIFVVSDHRSYHQSSENDFNAAEMISSDQIIGRPLFVWMSYSSTQDFISKTVGIRWNRILTKL